jgi:uncharacterized protein (DUF305 family)
MTTVNSYGAAVLLVAACFMASGCSRGDSDEGEAGSPAPNIVQPGAPGEPVRELTPEELAEIEPPRHTAADVRFMQGMIHHHAQALWMTGLVEKRHKSRDIATLARRIDVSQESEIEQMRSWLEARAEPAPVLHRVHGHAHGAGAGVMPGMLTEDEMNRLQAARGAAFDRLFLRSMIRHHEGAVTMVNQLFARNAGAEPEAGAFARHVDADQQVEIARMRRMLTRLTASR